MHKRQLMNPQKLLLQIENKEYFETNSQWSSREQIPTAPGLVARVVHPSPATADIFGYFIVRYIYAFSSRHDVGAESEPLDIQDPSVWDKVESKVGETKSSTG